MIRSEIGSEFWDVPVSNNVNDLFPRNTQWYLSGRSALSAILKSNKIKTVALPSWCCDSMIKPFIDSGIRVKFYYTDGVRQQIFDTDCDAVLLMDYFGYSGYSSVPDGYCGIVIRDVTHSLFSEIKMDADYYYGSLRKWCGVYSGGFAWSKRGFIERAVESKEEIVELRRQAMKKKSDYIYGRLISKQYLDIFSEGEKYLDRLVGAYKAASEDIDRIKHLDIDFIRRKRRENATVLMEGLRPYCIFQELKDGDCPLYVPIMVKQRDELRKWLISNEIYCPIHWPLTTMHSFDHSLKEIYYSELSLICDQRYQIDDMKRIVNAVKEGLNYVENIHNRTGNGMG